MEPPPTHVGPPECDALSNLEATSPGKAEAPRFIYADRQRARNSEYATAYGRWFRSLSPEEQKRLEQMGLNKASVSYRAHLADVDLEVERMAIADTPERSDEFTLALTEAIGEFLHWLILPPGQRGLNAKAIGQRAIMAMWVIRPDIIGNLSTTEIGALVDARPEVLSRQAHQFSKRFGVHGRAQFRNSTRMAQSEAAKERHARKVSERYWRNGGQLHGPN